MSGEKHHIVSYRLFLIVLVILLILTGISVAVTRIELGPLTVTVALLIATVKSGFVLTYFMHLKFDNRMFTFMVLGVFAIIAAVIFITFLDYMYNTEFIQS
jgi:cytochrome c oxidase subunit 4